jgi:hypothetical protein
MFKKAFAVCVLIICLSCPAKSQAVNMDTYVNQLFFNIFKENPDTAVLGFLKLYIPSLYQKQGRTGWPVQTSLDTTRGYKEMHSFIFSRHPFLNLKFAQGALEIICRRYDNDKPVQAITKVQLSFEFETPEDAETAFGRLINLFTMTATQQKINTTLTTQRAQFTDAKIVSGFNKVQFRVAADNLGHYRYKILFETGNEL